MSIERTAAACLMAAMIAGCGRLEPKKKQASGKSADATVSAAATGADGLPDVFGLFCEQVRSEPTLVAVVTAPDYFCDGAAPTAAFRERLPASAYAGSGVVNTAQLYKPRHDIAAKTSELAITGAVVLPAAPKAIADRIAALLAEPGRGVEAVMAMIPAGGDAQRPDATLVEPNVFDLKFTVPVPGAEGSEGDDLSTPGIDVDLRARVDIVELVPERLYAYIGLILESRAPLITGGRFVNVMLDDGAGGRYGLAQVEGRISNFGYPALAEALAGQYLQEGVRNLRGMAEKTLESAE